MRHKYADLGGPVHYIDFGGDGEPLLMVHGLGGSALNWMAVGDEVAKDHHALAIDLAGFGQTPLSGRSAAVGSNAVLVHDFIETVVGRPVVLAGNSMGGHIAVLEAAANPDWVERLILVDPAIPGVHIRRPEPAMLGMMAALSVPGLAQALIGRRARALGPEGLVRWALELVCADATRVDTAIVDAHVELTRERERLGRQADRIFLQAARSIGLRMADPRFWRRVAQVKAPTLVVHGSLDRLIPVAAARELARRRPDWELGVIDGVGHVPMLEAPVQFMDVLRSSPAYRIARAPAPVA